VNGGSEVLESFYPFLTFLIPVFSFFFNWKIQNDVVFVKLKEKKNKKIGEPVWPTTRPSHRFLPVLTGSCRVNCMTDPNVGSNRPTHRFMVRPVRPAGPSRVLKLCNWTSNRFLIINSFTLCSLELVCFVPIRFSLSLSSFVNSDCWILIIDFVN